MENAEIIKKLSIKYKDECEKRGIKSTDSDANIFEILQIENKEVLFCRFLGYVLDPRSKLNNEINDLPVKLFIKNVLEYEQKTDDFEFSVQLEEPTEKKRRVDIVIHAGNMVFPLEVKINAGDQPSQLYDYYHHYFGNNQREPNCVYYLTPKGKEPSEESITKIDERNNKHSLGNENYKLIGYGTDNDNFMAWLNNLENFYEGISQFLIQQYIAEVKSIVKSEEILMALDESLSLNFDCNNDDFENNKGLLIDIIKNADSIKTKIQRKYLLKHIKDLEEFVLSSNISESDISKDKYCILKINRKADNKTVAWIAVETYLYIIAEDLEESAKTTDDPGKNPECWEIAKTKYCWRYILVGNKKFKLSNIENCNTNQEIDLKSILLDIKTNDLPK